MIFNEGRQETIGLKREWFLMKGDKFRLTRFYSQNKNELNLFSLYFWLDEDKLVPRSYLDNNTRVDWKDFSQSPQTTSTNSHISTGVKELSKACENDGASGSMNDDNDFSCLNEDEEIDLQGVNFSQAIPSSLIINENNSALDTTTQYSVEVEDKEEEMIPTMPYFESKNFLCLSF